MKIIGLTGTAGAGKDTVAEIICKQYGFVELSTSEFVRHLARFVYDLPPSSLPVRDQLFDVATFMRKTVSPASAVEFCLHKAQVLRLDNVMITGLRTVGEANELRKHSGLIVAVDADSKLRYKRITSRKRDSESAKTYQEFLEQDSKENQGSSQSGDGLGIHFIIEQADDVITNNGSLIELEQAVSGTLIRHIL